MRPDAAASVMLYKHSFVCIMRYKHFLAAAHMTITTVADLFRTARNGLSQKEFAQQLGVGQSAVSRYENGTANPPTKVIDRCMHLVHSRNEADALSADELAAKVKLGLGEAEHGPLRHALGALIDTVTRTTGTAHGASLRPR